MTDGKPALLLSITSVPTTVVPTWFVTMPEFLVRIAVSGMRLRLARLPRPKNVVSRFPPDDDVVPFASIPTTKLPGSRLPTARHSGFG